MRTLLKYGAMLVGLLASLILGVVLTVGSCGSVMLPTALAADTATTVEQAKTASTNVFDEIQGNIDLVAKLKGKVQEAQLEGSTISLNSVIGDIETVTQSYESLAGQRDDIRQGLLEKVANVEKMRMAIDAEIGILRGRRADYSEQLRLVGDTNPAIAQTRREALSRAIGYVDIQIQLWEDFSDIQGNIVVEMSDIQLSIDSFLSMIESTAIVFREGLNLLHLQQDIEEALHLFASDIPQMEQLTSDMEKSWDTLDYLLETLTGIASIGITQ